MTTTPIPAAVGPARVVVPYYLCTRDTAEAGWGFPSACRALARCPRNLNDPNNYYALLGLWPWAPVELIKRRARALMARHHPDGPLPNVGLYARVAEIKRVLTSARERAVYDAVPPGMRYVDSEVRAEFEAAARARGTTVRDMVDRGEVVTGDPPEVRADGERVAEHGDWWDWFFTPPRRDGDAALARRWYPVLLAAAATVGYGGVLKLVLTDDECGFSRRTGLTRCPRAAAPGPTEAEEVLNTPTVLPHH